MLHAMIMAGGGGTRFWPRSRQAPPKQFLTPADHVIEPAQEFRRAVQAAAVVAAEHPRALITFGIPPTFPATGYGYVHRSNKSTSLQGVQVFPVRAFREKPDRETAER